MTDIAVVVPCYNEEKRLQCEAFVSALDAQPRLRFRMVNDGSRDRTADVLDSFAATTPGRISVTHLAKNSGKAEAVRRGILDELDAGARYVGFWDADLATPLDEIARFTALLDERPHVEAVIGSRVKLLGREIERKLYRHLYGRVFATTVSLLLGLPVYDTQCGAKLFRAGTATRDAFAEPFMSRWIFDVEVLARLVGFWGDGRASERIVEQPLRRWIDVAGSKVGARDALRAFGELARMEARYGHTLRR